MKWISKIIILTALEIAFVMAILKAIFGLSTALSFGIVSIVLALVFAFALGAQITRRRYEGEPVLDSPFGSPVATEDIHGSFKNAQTEQWNIGRAIWDKRICCPECDEPAINSFYNPVANTELIHFHCDVCKNNWEIEKKDL